MNLVIHELGITGSFGNTSLRQLITVGTEDLDLYALRPHLYKHLAPAGSLFMRIEDTNQKKIKQSETIAISTISSANYFHGYVRFLIGCTLKKNTQYYVSLHSTGYTYSGSAFIGWCNDFDLRKVTADYSPNNGVNGAMDFEIWRYQRLLKGAA